MRRAALTGYLKSDLVLITLCLRQFQKPALVIQEDLSADRLMNRIGKIFLDTLLGLFETAVKIYCRYK